MHVLAYDKYPSHEVEAEFVSLDELFRRSDVISLHCPMTDENYHMINRDSMASMKDGVVLINTSRGALIDAEDLIEGIKSKKVGAACLDVYEEESDLFFEDKSGHILRDDVLARLLSMPNVLLTSHQAFLTEEALDSIAATTVENITAFFRDGRCENEVCYRCERTEQCRRERAGRCF
jgi:D-lactate dehydrogenase